MAATPEQWQAALKAAIQDLAEALELATALQEQKVALVGLRLRRDTRYEQPATAAQIQPVKDAMEAKILSAFNVIKDTRAL